jgi:hypothetical protein
MNARHSAFAILAGLASFASGPETMPKSKTKKTAKTA